MAKRIISLLILIFCLMTVMPISLPSYAASVNINIDNPNWGILDGETIKDIPHLLSIERFLGNISGMYGANITKELYMPDGETPVTDGDITDGMKLKIKSSSGETIYTLNLMSKVTEESLQNNTVSSYIWPRPSMQAPDIPTHGVYVFEGALKLSEYTNADVTVSLDGDKWMRPVSFTSSGYITQTTSNDFVVQVPYELNKDYQYVGMIDLDNKKYWLYINGVLVSADKINGDSHTRIYPGVRLHHLSVYRPMSYFEFYVIPSVKDFDITPYKCNLSSNTDNVLIDTELAKITIKDDSILNKKDLFDTFVFENEEIKEKVKLYNAMGEEVKSDTEPLKDSFKVRVPSKNGRAKLEYSIETGREDPNLLSQTTVEYKKFDFLKKLGLFNETEEVSKTTTVSRGNFARYLTKLANLKTQENAESNFVDVVEGSTLSGYVDAVVSAGFMSGKGNGEFGANLKITYNEAITALVRVAGYEQLAKYKGGYPSGYIYAAQTAKMLNGIELRGEESLSKIDAVKLFYNTLLAPYNEITTITPDYDIYNTYEDVTVLKKLHGIIKDDGRVITNQFTDLYEAAKTLKSGMISIDGVKYNIPKNSNYENCLGMKVDFFYEDDTEAPYNIFYVMPKEDTESKELSAESISGTVGRKLRYFDENNEVENCEIADGFSFIYNGKLDAARTMEDLAISDGTLTLIDSEGTGVYDVVIAKVPEVYEFEAANANKGAIYTTTAEIEVDDETGNVILTDEYENETKISVGDIPYPSTLTVYSSKDGKCINIYVTTKIVTGKVTEKNEDGVVVNSRPYKFVPDFDMSTIEISTSYDFKMDALGRIAFAETATVSNDYGFLVGFNKGKGLDERPKIRIVTAPEEYTDYTIAEKIKLNGVKVEYNEFENHPALFTNNAITSQLIKYTLDANSEIKSIESGLVGESINDYYMVTGGLNLLGGSYIIAGNTYFLTVPIEEQRMEAKFYRKPELQDNQQYSVTVYDINEDTREPGAVIQYATESLVGGASVDVSAETGVVESVIKGINNDGVETDVVYVMHGGEIKKLFTNEENADTNVPLQFGDVIRFTLNSRKDTMLNYALEFRINCDGSNYEIFQATTNREYIQRYGTALSRNANYIVMNDEVNNKELIVPVLSNRGCKVDFASKTITPATVNDFIPNQMGVYARSYLIKAPTVLVGYEFE